MIRVIMASMSQNRLGNSSESLITRIMVRFLSFGGILEPVTDALTG